MKTRAQTHSAAAFAAVGAVADGKAGADPDKYRTCCHKMPGLLHQSGLLQSLVFVVARDAHGERYVDDLAVALGHRGHLALIERAQKAKLPEYVALTDEVADLAQWFRRFAQIQLGEEG